MREEDDDLLRAAEELGIDLSGVRAGDETAPPTSRPRPRTTPRPARRGRGRGRREADGPDDDDVETVPDIDVDGSVDIADLPQDR